LPDQRDQMRAAPFVADPSRYADVAVRRKIGFRLAHFACKAVDDRAGKIRAVFFQYAKKVAECAAPVKERWLSKLRGNGKLILEAFAPSVLRGKLRLQSRPHSPIAAILPPPRASRKTGPCRLPGEDAASQPFALRGCVPAVAAHPAWLCARPTARALSSKLLPVIIAAPLQAFPRDPGRTRRLSG